MEVKKQAKLNENVERIMIPAEQISARVKELAAQLDKLYEGRTPVVVCILKGSVMFFADLIREMKTPLQIDFMAVSSYGKDTISSGKLPGKKRSHREYFRQGRADRGRHHRFGKHAVSAEKNAEYALAEQREYRNAAR